MFTQRFRQALNQENDFLRLREELVRLRVEGVDRETLMAELNAYHDTLEAEEDKDTILEALDFSMGGAALKCGLTDRTKSLSYKSEHCLLGILLLAYEVVSTHPPPSIRSTVELPHLKQFARSQTENLMNS